VPADFNVWPEPSFQRAFWKLRVVPPRHTSEPPLVQIGSCCSDFTIDDIVNQGVKGNDDISFPRFRGFSWSSQYAPGMMSLLGIREPLFFPVPIDATPSPAPSANVGCSSGLAFLIMARTLRLAPIIACQRDNREVVLGIG
jgi:hypothetical protein